MSICIVCSSGGHLAEMLVATSGLDVERYFITFDEPHVRSTLQGEEVCYVVDPHVSVLLYLKNFWQSLKIFLEKRPPVVISNGAGIALMTCLLAKLGGSKLIYIETGARIMTPSRTGKIVYRFADLFIVQWKSLLKHYPGAVYGGPLL
ncbi:oligosaccharide biosynthesis protein Alg14 [Thiogranum longum]|uniref:Oligosaccharide biosynthesis protein Alg14 n=1 Tax=Thiogranum longum TaxID=1537524 RepID=A0A4R1HGD1_9GAMM|nr:PssD/Cps14F family polysaccharide biosynthesis glycosyltransferase [Thiogranum longum]TCK19475.1 oligosaccharide biosynthesis protein Alg14 [Thiogranum longum]